MIDIEAEFCRECGASDGSGWGQDEDNMTDGYAESDDFDYDEFLQREFPGDQPRRANYKAFVIVLILVGFLASLLLAF